MTNPIPFLTEAYNKATNGIESPKVAIYVGQDVWDGFEANIIHLYRYSDVKITTPPERTLKFKAGTMYRDSHLPPDRFRIEVNGETRWFQN